MSPRLVLAALTCTYPVRMDKKRRIQCIGETLIKTMSYTKFILVRFKYIYQAILIKRRQCNVSIYYFHLKKMLTRGQDMRIGGRKGVCEGRIVIVVWHLMMRMMRMMHPCCDRCLCDCTPSSNIKPSTTGRSVNCIPPRWPIHSWHLRPEPK